MNKSGSALICLISLFTAALSAPLLAADDSGQPPDVFQNLKFRNLGPASAGGRVAAVAGVPGNPDIYYVGGGAGGVWKSTDAGLHWQAIFEHEATASIGAIAVAPSNPNYVWVGTGEANIRNDVLDGAGVYFSPDAGKDWQYMGLKDAGQISRVIVDPADASTVWVAVLGHTWGPNPDRGVFKTSDGGKTWKKVLYVNDQTGAADLAMSPANPKVLFAATWQAVRHPWELVDGGTGSGLWRSTDGGDTWKQLSKDLPSGVLGRIAVAVAPSNPQRVYALIEAKKEEGLLWSSDDMGDSWQKASSNHSLDVRPFYFSRMAVSPDDEDKVYFLSFFLMKSEDGGHSAHIADRGVHPDHHALWIDPSDPKRILQGNDGGAYLSVDGGKTWRFLDGMPLEQDYMVAADSRTPYDLCGGLQDNSAWCGPSSSLADGVVSGNDWYTVTGGDGEYAVPAPSDPDIIYVDSQDGAISRFDLKTKRGIFVMPYLHGPGGIADMKEADAKYRFNWTSPIAVSLTDANTVYLGGNVLFKTTDGGLHWSVLSGDLTRNDKSKQDLSGGPINKDISGAETYDTILSITLAPTDAGVIWLGTDDGLVQLTRDGGKTWSDVTPSGAPKWARVYQLGVSPFDAGTAYAAFDGHLLDDKHAYVFRTDDYGKTWKRIDKGLPDQPVLVVREDPNQRGLLMLGNMTGIWYSRDSGGRWQQLKANFPTAPVFDLKFVRNDLAVATHGRGLFVLDDLRPLEQLTDDAAGKDFKLLAAAPGIHLIRWSRGEGAEPGYTVPNGPDGVAVDYFLKKEIKVSPADKAAGQSPVKIVITDSKGGAIATKYGPSKQGVNRFVWDMQYDPAIKLNFEKSFDFGGDIAPAVLPGTYGIAVTVNGVTEKAMAEVSYDPNQDVPLEQVRTQTALGLKVRSQINAFNEMLNRLTAMNAALSAFENTLDADKDIDKSKYQAALDQAKALEKKLGELKDAVYNSDVQHDSVEDDIHYLSKLDGELNGLYFGGVGDPAPMIQSVLDFDAEVSPKVTDAIAKFNALLQKDVPDYNKAAYAAGAPTLMVGEPVVIKPAPSL